MIKILAPIFLFILIIYLISYYWDKINPRNKKIFALILGIILVSLLLGTTMLVIQ